MQELSALSVWGNSAVHILWQLSILCYVTLSLSSPGSVALQHSQRTEGLW